MRPTMFLAVVTCVMALGASAPPATAQAGGGFRIAADTVTAGNNAGVQGVPCVNETVFFPGDVVVFRAVILDGPSGTPLTQADVASRGVEAIVTTSEGRNIPMRFGLHPPPQAVPNATKRSPYWSGTMPISRDHPTGSLPWSLTVTDKSGQKTTYSPIGQDAGVSVLTIATPKT
jgi:hypothetical protein